MQYQALYRTYRPQRFDEVVGQDHVTSTLAREVVEDKVAHAYLFTGPRGTGKTTTARLLAKSLNCPNRDAEGEPCNTCPSCVGITEGTSLDVIELDAASHNKVEDVREIRVNVGTVAAAPGAHRVYILDEAHMLSRAAGNALLKTLEEPPEHVVFVLATTEPYKLLDTIRSRSQRFDFHPVPSETLSGYLATIAAKEGFEHDHAGISAISAYAGGSVRDAMSLLEQVAALGGGTVSAAGVERALGLADRDTFRTLVRAIVDQDAAAGLSLVADLARTGADLRRFVADAIGYLRGVFLTQYASNVDEVVDASKETIAEWQTTSSSISSAEVLRAIDELSEALIQLRDGREERLVVELAVLRITKPEVVADLESVTARLVRVEREVREVRRDGATDGGPRSEEPTPSEPTLEPDRPFTPVRTADTTAPPAPATPPTPSDRDEPTSAADPSAESDAGDEALPAEADATDDGEPSEVAAPEADDTPVLSAEGAHESHATTIDDDFTITDFERIWPAVVASIRADVGPRRHALLREAVPVAVNHGTVTFEVASHMHFHLEQLKTDDALAAAIAEGAATQLGRPIRVAYRSADVAIVDREPEPVPDKDELDEGSEESDPTSTVLELLGGEVVQDTGRE